MSDRLCKIRILQVHFVFYAALSAANFWGEACREVLRVTALIVRSPSGALDISWLPIGTKASAESNSPPFYFFLCGNTSRHVARSGYAVAISAFWKIY